MSANTVGPSPIQPGGKPPEVDKKEKANVAGAGSLNKEAAKNVGPKDPNREDAKKYILNHSHMTDSKLNLYLRTNNQPDLKTIRKEIEEDKIQILLQEVPVEKRKDAETFLRKHIINKQPEFSYYLFLRANQYIPDHVEEPPKLNTAVPPELQSSTEITVTREPEASVSSKSASQKEFESINREQSEQEDKEILKLTDPKCDKGTIQQMIHNLREQGSGKEGIIYLLTFVGFIKK